MTELKFIARIMHEERAVELMRLASNLIREECSEALINYDDTTCDGLCLAGELWDLAEWIEQKSASEIVIEKVGLSDPKEAGAKWVTRDEMLKRFPFEGS